MREVKSHTPSHVVIFMALVIFLCLGCSRPEGLSQEAQYNDFRMQMLVDRKIVKVGEPVTATLTVKNAGKRVAVLESQDTPVVDIQVSIGAHSELDASWSAENPGEVIHRLELQPEESKTVQFVWTLKPEDRQVSAGVAVSGMLYARSRIVQGATVHLCIDYCR